jgi:MOSC domain-containing protein YiiM
MTQKTASALEAGLDHVRQSPADRGVLEMIVRRPRVGERDVLQDGELTTAEGLAGDSWRLRRPPNPDMQLNIMSARVLALVAGDRTRWPLAGDQLIVDLDLSGANLPPGTRLSIGSAVVEVTAEPHTGCRKFVDRFGLDAQKFVNSPIGRRLNLRGINARVVQSGAIRVGDVVAKVADR